MNRLFFIIVSLLAAPQVHGQDVDFARDILPILSDNCFACHGPDAKDGRKGDLRLDDEDDVKRQRDGYRVIDVATPRESVLLSRIKHQDPDEQMPPPEVGRSLTRVQRETMRQWISQGAPWGRHWAFEVPKRPPTEGHPIDHLVGRTLAEEGLSPNERAPRATLIRRLKLDLTGLPPTPEETAAFLNDSQSDAWERLVDQTLESPAYGERMAWDWLEAARYADTNGYQGDNERTMWPWRDWVVKAFNENLSFDNFTIWQLAGDLLPEATHEQILATGFNRNHMINGEGGRIPEENRVDYVMDMAETMGTVWLGLTLNCCRCHDHKFDPLKQREYYQFNAFFNQTPVDGGGGNAQTAPVLAIPNEAQKNAIAEQETALKAMKDPKRIEEAKKALNQTRGRIPKVMVMKDREKHRPTYILKTGLYDQRGEEVEAGVPEALPPLPDPEDADRLDLARWLVSPDHPLTARVTVNRFWQMLFGIGLVKTAEDFGVQSEYPR
ncbi:MAG: PSD1 and planctomycete cytochrome C domain-containing protein, partial [Verrucomicrobiales bacterium]|nr:PSD1 and planctomycete cytochrome C domain-containing protein [Verrucomicrobiales bacterium]